MSGATTMSECAGHIVYQANTAIFGFGATIDEAVAEANKWVDPAGSLHAEDVQTGGNGDVDGKMYSSPATEALISHVREFGGDVAFWHNENGVADLYRR